jgi:hypothetical protein
MAISKTISKAIAKKLNPAMGMKGFPPNVRSRNLNGALRRVRGDKLIKTVRKQFGMSAESLAGHSGNMKLGTLREMRGVTSEKAVLKGIFGLKGGRSVNANGQIRGKRADTLLKTVRNQYGRSAESFAGHSGQMQLGTLQEKRGISSVKDVLDGVIGFVGGRKRTASGAVRMKRGDTLARTLEQQYSVQFPGRNDKHLKTLRKELGATSIKDLLAKVRQ